MKEPKGHEELDLPDWAWDQPTVCAVDGAKWPCKKWRKWTASKEYRIQELKATVTRLGLDSAGNRKELASLREAHRRLELLVRGGVMLYLRDSGANISERVEVDYQDHTLMDGRTVRSASHQEYTVEYTGKNRRYVNGRLEEETFG